MNDYPEKYKNLLKEDEEVIWHEKAKPIMNKATYIGSSVVLFALIFIAILTMINTGSPGGIFFIFILLVIFSITSYNYASNNLYYLATNKRIILDRTPHSKFEISSRYYKNIYEINNNSPIGSDSVVCYLNPRSEDRGNGQRQYSNLRKINNPVKTMAILREAWMKESPYQYFNEVFEKLAEKYYLEFEGFHPNGDSEITLEGNVEGMKFEATLSNLYDIKKLEFSILCPNEEDNHILIRREKIGSNIGKLVGMQDLKINDPIFDARFILQSDNQQFLEYVLNPELRKKILDAAKILDWKIFLGIKKDFKNTENESYTYGTDDILDADVITETPSTLKRIEGKESQLWYECSNLKKDTYNLKLIANQCIINIEAMIELAEAIKDHNDK